MGWFCRAAVALTVGLVVWNAISWLCGDSTFGEALNPDAMYPGICLDAGHGGSGACKWYPPCTNGDGAGSYGPNGLTEAWVNHAVVPRAKDNLEVAGINVQCTKDVCTEDAITQEVSPYTRAIVANSYSDADVLISVHHQDIGIQKTEVFYAYKGDSYPETTWKYKLATSLANEINRRFQYGMQVKDDRLSGPEFLDVLQYAWMPAALIEGSDIGFPEEEDLMANDYWHRENEALGIRDGFLAYADTLTCPQNFDCDCDEDADGYAYFWWDEVDLA
jgi:N-acetylmuramoyl-L-alanine amidase